MKPGQTMQEIRKERAIYVEEILNKAKEYNLDKPKKTTLDHFYDKPIKENYVLLMGLGRNVRGNMQYILDELNHNPKYAHLQMFVRTSEETDEIVKNFIDKNHWDRTTTVYKTAKYDELLETCKYMITEIFFSEFWIKREEQVVINIWHGTPLKRLGLAKKSINKYADGPTQRNFIVANYLLYPNDYTRDNMLQSYRVSGLCQGNIVMSGYPRTGAIIDQSHNEETLSKLAPKGEHIYVYMPTWKDYLSLEKVLEESKELLDYLDDNLRDDQILYVNLHHKVSDSLDYSQYKHIKQFPSDIDSYRIQAASDALITDYSSVFYDYSACGKNIILYCNDLELYEKKRGTYMDLRELPFHKARTPEAVLEGINQGKTYDDSEFVKDFCTRDSVDNAKKLCELFVDDESGLEICPIPKENKQPVLLYNDDFVLSRETSKFLKLIAKLKKQNKDVYLSGDAIMVRESQKAFVPVLKGLESNNIIGVKTTPRYTTAGYYAKDLYEQGHISFSEAMKVMKYDYYAEYLRYFGTEDFEFIKIIHTVDAERLLALCGSTVATEVCVNKTVLESVEQGNTMLKDALKYLMTETDVKVTIPRLRMRKAKKILELE